MQPPTVIPETPHSLQETLIKLRWHLQPSWFDIYFSCSTTNSSKIIRFIKFSQVVAQARPSSKTAEQWFSKEVPRSLPVWNCPRKQKLMGPHCRKHQPSDLNFAILSSVQPRETGQKKHQLARTKAKRKGESSGEISDAFIYDLSHTMWQQNRNLFFMHVQLKGRLCCSGHAGLVASVRCWIPQSCLTHGPALSQGCPNTCIPPAGVRARSQMVWESGNTGTDASRAICIRAAFLSRADPELRVLQPVQPWWSLASATVKRHCCHRPDCPLLSAAVRVPRERILLQDHTGTNIAERRQCRISFFTDISAFLAVSPHAG